MNYDCFKNAGAMTISALKNLIKECLREIADEKQFSDKEYKALWLKK